MRRGSAGAHFELLHVGALAATGNCRDVKQLVLGVPQEDRARRALRRRADVAGDSGSDLPGIQRSRHVLRHGQDGRGDLTGFVLRRVRFSQLGAAVLEDGDLLPHPALARHTRGRAYAPQDGGRGQSHLGVDTRECPRSHPQADPCRTGRHRGAPEVSQ